MNVVCLVATKDRPALLLERAIPSVIAQTHRPTRLVIVSDGRPLADSTRDAVADLATSIDLPITVLQNSRTPGPGGAWNTGLAYLASLAHRGFVAILDDDDVWSKDHVEANIEHSEGANIVVSGLRLHLDGRLVERPLIASLNPRAFLVGNPGWQGSNTFVDLNLLIDAGGFREGLPSLNDRDLALRLLRHPLARWRLTGQWTATWYADTPGNLSAPRSQSKVRGLRAFWAAYRGEMSEAEQEAYLARADRLFGVTASSITTGPPPVIPPLGFQRSSRDA